MQRLAFFQDAECKIPLSTVGENEAGEPKQITFYVKNVGGTKVRKIWFETTFPNITNIQINFPSLMLAGTVVKGTLVWHPPNNTEGEVEGILKANSQSIGI